MGSPVKPLSSFCHLCMSPSPHHHDHPHIEYSRCLEMRMNLDYSASRSSYDSAEGYSNSPYPGSPQSRSSCMYSLHANSPPIVHPLALRSSAEQFMSPSKENGLFRDILPQCRRRLDFNHNDFIGLSKAVPVTVAKRNERERNRVKLINTTFQTLRQHLPVQSRGAKGQAKKLSKVQTLRSAIEYIRKLEDLIEERKSKQSQNKEITKESNIKKETYENEGDAQRGTSETNTSSFETRFPKEIKQYPTINNNIPTSDNERTDSSNDSRYYRPNISLYHDNNNGTRNTNNDTNNNNNINSDIVRPSDGSAYHRDQQYQHPRSYYHQKNPFQDRRTAFEGVDYRYNSPSGHNVNKCHSEGGSASPVDSDISGDVTATEEDEFFDFDLWFWTD